MNWQKSIQFLNQRVVFSNYDFDIIAAHDRSVEPGQTAVLTYAIENTGVNVDDYQVNVSGVKMVGDGHHSHALHANGARRQHHVRVH